MAEPVVVAPADTHEIMSDLDTIANAIGSLATKIAREMDPERRADALRQFGIISVAARALYEGLGCSETGTKNVGPNKTLHLLPAHTQETTSDLAQVASQAEGHDLEVTRSNTIPMGAPEYVTLHQSRKQKIIAALQEAGETGASGPELGAALGEPDLTAPTRRMAVSRCLASLASEGYAIGYTGGTRSRRYRLPALSVAQSAPSSPRKKLTRWGLEQEGADLFVSGRPLVLSDLAGRCLGLLLKNPRGISRGTLLRTLREQERAAGAGMDYSEEDVRRALGEIREQVESDRKSPRIYEQHATHDNGHTKLLRLAGLLAA